MRRSWILLSLASSLMLLTSLSPARGGELKPDNLPVDTKWLLHFNADAFRETELADKLEEKKSKAKRQMEQYLKSEYGIDAPDDLSCVTLLGSNYDEKSGVALIGVEYDPEMTRKELKSKPDAQTSEFKGVTFITFRAQKKDFFDGMSVKDSEADSKSSDSKSDSGNSSDIKTKMVTVALMEELIACSCSKPDLKALVRVIKDDAASLGDIETPLTQKRPDGAFLFGAAIELGRLEQYEPLLPVLSRHERIVYAAGAEDGQLYEKATLVAESSDVAGQMVPLLEGFRSLGLIAAGENQALTSLINSAEIKRDGDTVEVCVEGQTDTVYRALRELKSRMKEAKQLMET